MAPCCRRLGPLRPSSSSSSSLPPTARRTSSPFLFLLLIVLSPYANRALVPNVQRAPKQRRHPGPFRGDNGGCIFGRTTASSLSASSSSSPLTRLVLGAETFPLHRNGGGGGFGPQRPMDDLRMAPQQQQQQPQPQPQPQPPPRTATREEIAAVVEKVRKKRDMRLAKEMKRAALKRRSRGGDDNDAVSNSTSSSPSSSSSPSPSPLRPVSAKQKMSSPPPPSSSSSSFKVVRPADLDTMRARANVLRASILRKQLELQELERQILCCSTSASSSTSSSSSSSSYGSDSSGSYGAGSVWPLSAWADLLETHRPLQTAIRRAGQTIQAVSSSTSVLLRKLDRVRAKQTPDNMRWNSVGEFVKYQSETAGRIVRSFVDHPERLSCLIDPHTPALVPYVPAILARLDRLEGHVAPILERVLNNRRHLASVEPYLPEVLERFDDIEPHLPWILDNIDALAPYTGLLLRHIDELLLYADVDEYERTKDGSRYDLAEQLLPYLEFYVSKLDVVGPHLPLLRPHVPLLLKHGRLARVTPHIDRLFARGYSDLSASANLDVLLFWFGWALRVPGLPRLFFALPWSPRIVSFLANRLPRKPVRGYCSSVTCLVDGGYGSQWNSCKKARPVKAATKTAQKKTTTLTTTTMTMTMTTTTESVKEKQ